MNRTRMQRLLNYKRYVDWLVEQELERIDSRTVKPERCAECNKRLGDEEKGQRICELCSAGIHENAGFVSVDPSMVEAGE